MIVSCITIASPRNRESITNKIKKQQNEKYIYYGAAKATKKNIRKIVGV
jgi:hypothetical protein